MSWKLLVATAFAFGSTPSIGAECSRDFAGEWTREQTAGATAEDIYRAEGSGWSDRIRVSQHGGRISIESFYFAPTDMQPPLRFHYLPGQGTTENVVMVGQGAQKQVSDTRWNECRLVITTRYPAGDAAAGFTVTQTLWLEADALVVDTVRGASQANRTTYRRAAAAGGT